MTRTKQRGSITVFQALLIGPLPLSFALAQDWYVDVNGPGCPGTGTQADPFCDIMTAVAAASNGDTIHIAPGTYFGNVALGNKDLELIGTGGDQVTILDGMANGSVMTIGAAEVTLTGLTLTNGSGSPHPHYGGAIAGGGLFASAPVPGDFPRVTLMNCTVTGNSVVGNSYAYGGGVFVQGSHGMWTYYGSLTMMNSTVCRNTASSTRAAGGGVFGKVGTVTVTNSTVSENTSTGGPGAWDGAWGGGVAASCNGMTLTNSTVSGNVASSSGYAYGGGMSVGGASFGVANNGYLAIKNSILSNNSALGPNNYYGVSGSGLSISGSLNMVLSTVTGNADSGIMVGYGSHIDNSILWNNGSVPLRCPAVGVTVNYSLVEGGWPGIGNIDADPLFVDPLNGDYRLLSGSPCIDAGDNSAVPADVSTDIRGFPRFIDDPLTPDTGIPFRWRRTGPGGLQGATPRRLPVVDLGAYEFP